MSEKSILDPSRFPPIQSPAWLSDRWMILILFLSVFILYGNTLGHSYTQDDPIVITQNMYTTQGVQGIKGLLTKDTFFGYFRVEGKDRLVAGGRYRPLSLILFAIEYEIFGENPLVSHLMNLVFYGLLGIVLFFLLKSTLKMKIPLPGLSLVAFGIVLVYIFHPVHTEAVANVKGRDEILAFLLGASAWLLLISEKWNWKHAIGSGLLFFLALLSKENAITLLPVTGLSLYLIKSQNLRSGLFRWTPIVIASVIYLVLRFSILGSDLGDEPLEMMNNPFVKLEDGRYSFFSSSEKWSTILVGLSVYLRLLVFPHPLTNDYYPRALDVYTWSDPEVLFSLLLHFLILGAIIFTWKRNKLVAFGLLFYVFTISIFSNIVFPIGTHLSERFLFMPSFGFALLLGLSGWWFYGRAGRKGFLVLAGVILFAFALKTITRNVVWKDNFTLFTTDVHTSSNSAKALNAAGGALTDASKELTDGPEKTAMLNQAKEYLQKALQIHPNYKNAWLILGNVYYFTGNIQESFKAYDQALKLDPGYKDARNNKALVLRVTGREIGEKQQDLETAIRYFRESHELNPDDIETIRLLGVAEGIRGNHENAIKYFQRMVQMAPNSASGYVLLAGAYQNIGDLEKSRQNRQRALQINPNAFNN